MLQRINATTAAAHLPAPRGDQRRLREAALHSGRPLRVQIQQDPI